MGPFVPVQHPLVLLIDGEWVRSPSGSRINAIYSGTGARLTTVAEALGPSEIYLPY
jgi:hypothetical protein